MEKEFIKVLLKVQKELPVIPKTVKAFKGKYAPIEHIWEKVESILTDNEIVITNEIQLGGVFTRATHELGSLISFIPFSSNNLKSQDIGSEITYARRYNLTSMFNIIVAGEDDADQMNKNSNTDTNKIHAEIQEIQTKEGLNKYYQENKGLGKEVTQMLTNRKLEIQKQNENS